MDWLSEKLNTDALYIKPQNKDFIVNPYLRSYVDEQGNMVHLTAKEFDLLYFMYSHKGQVFTKEQLYDNVWGHDHITDTKNLTSFIRKLRKKIEKNPDSPQYILTVWGVGYKFNEEKP